LHAIRIFIIASHSLFAQGVSSLLDEQPDIQVVGLSEYSSEALQEVVALKPDVVVIDSEQSARGEITDRLLGRVPGLKLVGLSLAESNITITYLQQKTGAAVEDLVTAVRSLPGLGSWLPINRQMRILVALQGPFGLRMVETIQKQAPPHWNVSVWRAPPLMPPERESLHRLLPRYLPAADLLLGLAESPHMCHLLPEMVVRSGARALLVPVENQRWLPTRAVNELREQMGGIGVAVAFPKPFCSLTMRTYSEARLREEYQDAHIAEFARYFGRPELRVLFDEGMQITRCEVRRDSACGFAHKLAEKLVGVSLGEAEEKAAALLREHSCPDGSGIDIEYQAPLSHIADSIVREAVRREVSPFLTRVTDSVAEH
jgi:thymidylate synthase